MTPEISKLLISSLLSLLLLIHDTESKATDKDALLAFKAQVSGDPSGSLRSWSPSDSAPHFCSWAGVLCGDRQHPTRVTELSLPRMSLTGSISPNVANLTRLRTLNLTNNFFTGEIPSDFGRLSRLQYLDIRSNSLGGEIPPSLTRCSGLISLLLKRNNLTGQIPANFSQCANLGVVNLQFNQLTGAVPESFGSLQNLYALFLDGNYLSGAIPPSLGNLSSLAFLGLYQNSLQGRIPGELGKLSSLAYFDVAVNNLTGEIPDSLFNVSSTFYFHVGNNSLSGKLPQDLGTALPNLQNFYAFFNGLSGRIPSSLPNASRLQQFMLDGNMFSGTIPKNLGSLRELTAFQVGQNRLEADEAGDWDFLASLSNCSSLSVLYLTQNRLRGDLPISVANLSTTLTWLTMAGNKISGKIPAGMGRYRQLAVFDMSDNLLTGTIPSEIGMLQNLQLLHLDQNQLQGQIPNSIGNLIELNELVLNDNKFEGSIPMAIGNLSSLSLLDLSRNKLNGTIPGTAISKLYSLTQGLNLSSNLLTGSLPTQIGSLINLVALDVSENRLSGEIPSSLGACQLLGRLFMQGNQFEGNIPLALSGLAGIEELDLSHNYLSGPIPEFLGRFRLLHNLNLSFNDFQGPLPDQGVFRNSSVLSVTGNNKLCGGDPRFHLQQCDAVDGVTHRSSHHKVIIPVVVACTLAILLCAAYYIRRRGMKPNPPKPSLKESFLQVSYAEIQKATAGFSASNLIGAGSFGSVYKGVLDSDPNQVVAIKVLNLEQQGADKSFMAECDSLRVIRHRNLVNIVTICSSIDHNGNDYKALIFEYMPNGSLDDLLHPQAELNDGSHGTNSKQLSLVQRLNIAVDVALALDYLHHQCQTPIVHCDLKPSNVLLGYDMTARVCDFGLSRFLHRTINSSSETNSTIGVKGSIGYIPPEYGMGGTASTQGDVYSFGVLLLETFTGKRPTDKMFQDDLNLHKYVEMAYPDQLLDIIDPSIERIVKDVRGNYPALNTTEQELIHEGVLSIFRIGLLCSQASPNERIEMGDVLNELILVKKTFDGLEPKAETSNGSGN